MWPGLAARPALPERGRLADAIAKKVQLGPADLAVPEDLDLLDPRAVDLEGPLDADAARDPADGDRAGDPAAAEAHHDALEDLDPLAVALDDLGRHLDRVAGSDLREVGAELVGGDLVEHVHEGIPCRRQPEAAEGCRESGRTDGPAAEYSRTTACARSQEEESSRTRERARGAAVTRSALLVSARRGPPRAGPAGARGSARAPARPASGRP